MVFDQKTWSLRIAASKKRFMMRQIRQRAANLFFCFAVNEFGQADVDAAKLFLLLRRRNKLERLYLPNFSSQA